MPLSEALLPEFDEEMKNTRKMLERVPDEKFDYKPHEKSMTMGRLASHVAEMPSWAAHTHHATAESALFSFSDRVVQEKLGLWREARGNA